MHAIGFAYDRAYMVRQTDQAPFGVLLRRYRTEAAVSQAELAERAGLSLRGVSDLERGLRRWPHEYTVRRLADALLLDESGRRTLLAAARKDFGRRHPSIRDDGAQPSLPRSLTTFIGRQNDIAEIRRLLQRSRLMTLHGPGGVGKTRLALEVGRESASEYPDGLAFVDLAAVSDPDLVPASAAAALGLLDSENSPLESLKADLRSKQLLLILDNCEHVVESAAQMTRELLEGCAELHIVATSRESLGCPGEVVWEVPAMPFPTADADAVDAAEFDAVRLFVDRAMLAQPQFALTDANVLTIAEICRQLDGIPLSIELAAARVRVLGLEQIASRLHDAFALLSAGVRTAPPRHQTLRAAIGWSYALLSDLEQRVFASASVFATDWSLEAALAILSDDSIKERDVFELLTHLVDKSLVLADPRAQGGARYRLLETVRQYAAEQLEQRGDTELVDRRHALFFADLAEQASTELRGASQQQWLDALQREQPNLRVALARCIEAGDAELSQRIAGALAPFWERRGYLSEGLHWLNRALALQRSSPRVRARALLGAGSLVHYGAGPAAAERGFIEQSLVLCRQVDDRHGIAEALRALGNCLLVLAPTEHARARALFQESKALFEELEDQSGLAGCLAGLANLASAEGDVDRARTLFDELLRLARHANDAWQSAYALHGLGHLALLEREFAHAVSLLGESLELSAAIGDYRGISVCLQSLAVAAATRAPHRAARMFGAAAAFRNSTGSGVWGRSWLRLGEAARDLRGVLGADAYDAAWSGGASLSIDQAVTEALTVAHDAADNANAQRIAPLTPREWEVAQLVADGLTNRRIGDALVITEGTAALHVRHILNKLGFEARAQIATWVTRRRYGISNTG